MLKYVLFILILFVNINAYAYSNIDDDVNFFLGKKYFHLKDYDRASILFKKVIKKSDKINSFKCKNSRLYLILIKIKLGKFKEAMRIAKKYTRIYETVRDRSFNHAKFMYALSLYNVGIEKFGITDLFRKRQYSKNLYKKVYKRLNYINYKDIYYPINLNKIKSKLLLEIKQNKILLLKDCMKKKMYISVVLMMKKQYLSYISDVHDLEMAFILLKAYNELFLDAYAEEYLKFIRNNMNQSLIGQN